MPDSTQSIRYVIAFDDKQAVGAKQRTVVGLREIATAAQNASSQATGGIERLVRSLAGSTSATQRMGQAWQRVTQTIGQGWQTARAAVETAGRGIVSMLEKIKHAHHEVDDETREFAAHIREFVENPLHGAGQVMESLVLSLGRSGAILLGTAAAVGLVAEKSFEFFKEQAEAAHEIELLATRTGLSIVEAQQYSAAARVQGVDVGALTTMIRGLSQSMSENGDEGKKGKRAMEDLGKAAHMTLTAFKPSGEMKETGELIHDIATALSTIPEGAERTRFAIALFSRAGVELLPLLGNVKELDRIMKQFGIPKEQIEALSQANKDITELGLRWKELELKGAHTLLVTIKFLNNDGTQVAAEVMEALFETYQGVHFVDRQQEAHPVGREVVDRNREIAREGLRADEIKRGNVLYDAAKAKRDQTLAGIEELLTKAKGELTKAENMAPRGTTEAAQRSAQVAIKSAQDEVTLLERKKALVTAIPEALKRAHQETLATQVAELSGMAKINAEYQKRLQSYTARTASGEEVSTLTPAIRAELIQQRANDIVGAQKKFAKELGEEVIRKRKETDTKTTERRAHDLEIQGEEGEQAELRASAERYRGNVVIPKETEQLTIQTQETRLSYVAKEAAAERDLRMESLRASSAAELRLHGLTEGQKLAISIRTDKQENAIEAEYRRTAADVEIGALQRQLAREVTELEKDKALKSDVERRALDDEIMARSKATGEQVRQINDTVNAEQELRLRQSLDRQASMVQEHYDQIYGKVKDTLGQIWDEAGQKGSNVFKATADVLHKTLMSAVKDRVTGTLADIFTPIFGGHRPPAVELTTATNRNTTATEQLTASMQAMNTTLAGGGGVAAAVPGGAAVSSGSSPAAAALTSALPPWLRPLAHAMEPPAPAAIPTPPVTEAGTGEAPGAPSWLRSLVGAPAPAAATGTSSSSGFMVAGPSSVTGYRPPFSVGPDIADSAYSLANVPAPLSAGPNVANSAYSVASVPGPSDIASQSTVAQPGVTNAGATGWRGVLTHVMAMGSGIGGAGGGIGGTGGGAAAGAGGLGRNWLQGLSKFTGIGQDINNGPGVGSSPWAQGTMGEKLSTVGHSPAAGMAGMALVMNGLQRGGGLGMAEDVGGGALVGFQYGGPIGAAIGAGVGAILGGLRWSGVWQTSVEKAQQQVKNLYGLKIDKKMAGQIVQMAQQDFHGDIGMAIRSQQVQQLLDLYAKSTGQNFPIRNIPRPLYMVQSGGKLYQAPSYENGMAIGLQGPLTPMAGQSFGAVAGSSPSPGAMSVSLSLNKESTDSLFTGRAVDAITDNPRLVQSAALDAASSSYGRLQQAGLLLSPASLLS